MTTNAHGTFHGRLFLMCTGGLSVLCGCQSGLFLEHIHKMHVIFVADHIGYGRNGVVGVCKQIFTVFQAAGYNIALNAAAE